ncbi:hypothetical protein FOL47_009603 [Perkinsus chesapeaki]|uniref:Uncharacterized protein n=1 Tax=Perkinsus chesapeaki TaxID=330153 RepID=A0A7J6MSA9_PERCH|nr:hypothetical protein FOL47_009603 [Perkinsus chesapeaki]
MATIITRLGIIVMTVSIVCEAWGLFTPRVNGPVPTCDKDLVKLVAGRSFRSSEKGVYTKEVVLSFDAHGEEVRISMSMSEKAKHPGRTYVSPWLNVKFPPQCVGQLGLTADDPDAFREFKQEVSMETDGTTGSFKCLVTRGLGFIYTIHVCAGAITSNMFTNVFFLYSFTLLISTLSRLKEEKFSFSDDDDYDSLGTGDASLVTSPWPSVTAADLGDLDYKVGSHFHLDLGEVSHRTSSPAPPSTKGELSELPPWHTEGNVFTSDGSVDPLNVIKSEGESASSAAGGSSALFDVDTGDDNWEVPATSSATRARASKAITSTTPSAPTSPVTTTPTVTTTTTRSKGADSDESALALLSHIGGGAAH